MSINVCSITGQPLSRPVVSRKTGHIYQKQAIQKHLSAFPYCPVTNQPMELSDLIQIPPIDIAIVRPNQSTRTFLNKIQNQYDTLVLQTHYLKQSLKQTKQQMMHCAYQNEAAQRVIARLLKQKADTENQILSLNQQLENKN